MVEVLNKKVTGLDYDIMYQESLQYFERAAHQIVNLKVQNDTEKARLGFYYLVFDLLFGETQVQDINNFIIDDHFVELVYKAPNNKNKDLGIDAVYIDRDEKQIYLLNFKFRKKFVTANKKPKHSEIRSAESFLNIVTNLKEYDDFIKREDKKDYQKTLDKIDEIRELMIEDSSYNIVLYMVTNDKSKIDENDPGTRPFLKRYENFLQLRDFNLLNIMDHLSIQSPENEARLRIDNIMMLEHNVSYDTKSYVIELNLVNLIRIASSNNALRKVTKVEEFDCFNSLTLDFNLLFDNVREYLGNNKINKKIIKTLSEEPSNFFLYNNGVTIVAEEISSKPNAIDESTELILKNYQIVNGGQTLRSIFKYKTENKVEDIISNLVRASVIVRLLVTSKNLELTNKISEYTNSQNPIKEIDLRSVDKIQLAIEQRLDQEGIRYDRKRGSGKEFSKKYDYTISMEKLGQVLFAYEGRPESAANSKAVIFSNYYDRIFNEDSKLFEKIIEQIRLYSEIGKQYQMTEYNYYEQKAYYVLFMKRCLQEKSVKEIIDILEDVLINYIPEKETTEARKFLQPSFKEKVIKKIKSLGGKVQGIFIVEKKRKDKQVEENLNTNNKEQFWNGFTKYLNELEEFNYKLPTKKIASYYTISRVGQDDIKCEFSVGAKTIGFIYGKKTDKNFYDFLVLNKKSLSEKIGSELIIRDWNDTNISNVQGLRISIKNFGLNYPDNNVEAYKILSSTFTLLDKAVQELLK
ncbi:AIPR family protein [Streptococcus sp. 20925_1_22]|uniref:AIPR family protein n=1 Tax=Streptococcus sp. 20925_1_22 TaxID=3003645 RepID=UPI0028D5DBA0|nr:AIPR family protein [uncultured Streptococcus sp.]